MPKRTTPPNKKFQSPSNAIGIAADETNADRDDPLARYALTDNLFDAIWFDVEARWFRHRAA